MNNKSKKHHDPTLKQVNTSFSHFFKILPLFAILLMSMNGWGQHFIESFENPDSWSGYTTGTVTFPSGSWDFVQVFPESSTNSYDGSKACRINDDKNNASITSPSVNGVGTVSFYYHRPFSGSGSFELQKSVGGGAFTTLATVDYSSVTSPTQYSYDVNDASNNIKIRILNDDNTAHLTIDYFEMGTYAAACSGEPTAQATNISLSNETDNSIDVSWTAGTGGDNYILVVREASSVSWAPTDGTDYSGQTGSGDFSSATDQGSGNKVVYDGSGTSTTVSGLSASTDYYFQVFHYCSSSSNDYLTSSGTGNDGSQNTSTTAYCISNGNMSFGTAVTRVQLNTIDNSTGAKANAYEDYTAQSTDLEIGSSYNLTVNLETDGAYTIYSKVWIDWNIDGDFDDTNEEYDLGTAYDVSGGPTSNSPLTVTVPTGISVGSTRMRVSARYGDYATSCETGYDGEVEDYTINIVSSSIEPEPSNHATAFSAVEDGHDEIILGWTDAAGTTTPDGYVVKANTSGSFTAPSDGTDPTEDADLSDGTALVKIAQGNEIHSFTGLSGSTTYYFKIWPYTNSGNDIDFKTEGTVPTANATTDAAPSIIPPAVGEVFISEVSDAPVNHEAEFIELYNSTGSIIDLSDCSIQRFSSGGSYEYSWSFSASDQIPANGFVVVSRGANLNEFTAEWAVALTADCNFYEGNTLLYFGTGRRWKFVYDDGSKANTIIDDTQTGVADGNRAIQTSAGVWTTGLNNWSATPGQLDGSQSTLPIHLLTFTGSGQDGYNLLQWATASEENNDYFTLEKSTDGEVFELVATIAGAGNSNEIRNYQAKDFNVDAGFTYYRLKQTDYNGAFTYSDIISVQSGEAAELSLNIVQQDQKLLLNLQHLQQGPITVELYDIHGRKILSNHYQNTETFRNIELNTAVEQGIYLLRVVHDQQIINKKLLF